MAQASTKFASKASTKPTVSKGAAAGGNRYAAQAKAPQSQLTQAQRTESARLSAQARKPVPKAVMPTNLAGVAKAMAGNMPAPIAAKPLQTPAWMRGSQMTQAQAQANLAGAAAPWSPQSLQQAGQNLATGQTWANAISTNPAVNPFSPQNLLGPTPGPTQSIDGGFNRYAPPTNTVLPDTYQGQINRIIERAMASGRTLPDTIQGMLDRLGQQYAPAGGGPYHEGLDNRMLPDTEEGAFLRIIEQMSGLSTDTGGTGGGPTGDTGGNGYPQQPSLADIMRWMYGSIYWRGW